jgi:secreted Zn-dependent insulinase-like peptidase
MLHALVKNKPWSFVECLSALTEVTVDDFLYVCRKFKSRMYVRTLMQGNLSKEQAIDILEMMKNEIKYEPLLPMSWPQVMFN